MKARARSHPGAVPAAALAALLASAAPALPQEESRAPADTQAQAENGDATGGIGDDSRIARDTLGAPASGPDSALEIPAKAAQAPSTRTHREKEVSRIRLSRDDLRNVTAAQGDPFKAIAALPGVSNQSDLNVRPFVRGGKAEETQVMWEGIPLLQPYHFGGVYSIFNIESLRDLTFHSGGFPAEVGNSLSGAIFMRARPAPLDSFAAFADLSLLRGNAYAGVPLVKNRLGISFSYQAFWYDWVLNRGLDAIGLFNDSRDFRENKRQFQSYIDLPNFKDLQLGLGWRLSDRLTGEYTGLISRDIFSVRDQTTAYFVNGREVSSAFYGWDLFYRHDLDTRERRTVPDTLAGVSVENGFHALSMHWNPSSEWGFDQTVAYQSQDWVVGFFDKSFWIDSIGPDERYYGRRVPGRSDYRLDIRRQTWDWRLDGRGDLSDAMVLRFGASYSHRTAEFGTHLPKVLFETIVNGNTDALDALGSFDPEGFTIRKDEPGSDPEIDYLEELPRLFRTDLEGNLSGRFAAAYASGTYEFDSRHRLTAGLRAEHDSYSDEASLSPRIAYFQSLGARDELTFASGLYSQGDFPFQVRAVNPSLRPEKAFHANLEWTHAFSRKYRLECQLYQKNYFDLVTPVAVNTGRLEWDHGPLEGQDSAVINHLPAAQYDTVVERYGIRRLDYRNGGRGKAAGAEVSFFYDPNPTWGGWLSSEVGYSKRQDGPGGPVYDFRYGRPWAFNWVNRFKLPNRFALSIRARWAAGLPYTDYVAYRNQGDGKIGGGFSTVPEDPDNDTLFHAGKRNGARYAPYSRWDLRLSREIPAHGHKLESYFEIWNAFNTPNFLLRDARTRQWKFVDLNYPFPILFLGISGRW